MKKALKDKPKWKPSEGYVYLSSLESGSVFKTTYNTIGIYLSSTPTSSTVIVTEHNFTEDKNDRYYLGKQYWGNNTEVIQI